MREESEKKVNSIVAAKQELRARMKKVLAANSGRLESGTAIWKKALCHAPMCSDPPRRKDLRDNPLPRLWMGYAEMPDEVVVLEYLFREFTPPVAVVLPYLENNEIHPLRIEGPGELVAVEPFGIREPRPELRLRAERQIDLKTLELIIVPGLAFDHRGMRLGRGKGYYDRFLSQIPKSIPLIALAFECQLVDFVPSEEHDRQVDFVVPEERIVCCHHASR